MYVITFEEWAKMQEKKDVWICRFFNDGRDPQTDSIKKDLVNQMIQGDEVEYAYELSVDEGIPNAYRIKPKGWSDQHAKYDQIAAEEAQSLFGGS
jgi:hypothetical protein